MGSRGGGHCLLVSLPLGRKKKIREIQALSEERSCRLQRDRPLSWENYLCSHYSINLHFHDQVAEFVCTGSNPTPILVLVRELTAMNPSAGVLSLGF